MSGASCARRSRPMSATSAARSTAASLLRLPWRAAIERGDVYLALDGERDRRRRRDRSGATSGIYIDQLGVDPARQGTGLGSFLLARIEEIARSSGLKGLSLETAEMAEGNIRLYRRHGFEIVGRGPPAHGMDAHTRVHMVKAF